MEVIFDDSCFGCDNRAACEVAAVKFRKIEAAARVLGFTVTEGSVTCEGKEPRPEPFDPHCGSRFRLPVLKSDEERRLIYEIEALEGQVHHVIPATQAIIAEIQTQRLE